MQVFGYFKNDARMKKTKNRLFREAGIYEREQLDGDANKNLDAADLNNHILFDIGSGLIELKGSFCGRGGGEGRSGILVLAGFSLMLWS